MANEPDPRGGEKIEAKNFELPTVGESKALDVPARGVALTLQNDRNEYQVGPAVLFTAEYPFVVEKGGKNNNICKLRNDGVHGKAFHATITWEEDPQVSLRPMSVAEVRKIAQEKGEVLENAMAAKKKTEEQIVEARTQRDLLEMRFGGEFMAEDDVFRIGNDLDRKLKALKDSLQHETEVVDKARRDFDDASEALSVLSLGAARERVRLKEDELNAAKQKVEQLTVKNAQAHAALTYFVIGRGPGQSESNKADLKKNVEESNAALKEANGALGWVELRLGTARTAEKRARQANQPRKIFVNTLRVSEKL